MDHVSSCRLLGPEPQLADGRQGLPQVAAGLDHLDRWWQLDRRCYLGRGSRRRGMGSFTARDGGEEQQAQH